MTNFKLKEHKAISKPEGPVMVCKHLSTAASGYTRPRFFG